jgi:hypothetical protein
MKCRIFVTTIALALIASISVFAAEGKKGKGGGGLLPPPIVEKLSADQKTKYDAILAEAKEAHGDKDKLKELRAKAFDLLTDDQKAEAKKLQGAHGKKKQ